MGNTFIDPAYYGALIATLHNDLCYAFGGGLVLFILFRIRL